MTHFTEIQYALSNSGEEAIWFAPENTPAIRGIETLDPWRSRVTRGDPWKAFLHDLSGTPVILFFTESKNSASKYFYNILKTQNRDFEKSQIAEKCIYIVNFRKLRIF